MRLVLIGIIIVQLLSAQARLEQVIALTRQKQYAAARQALQDVPTPTELSELIVYHRLRAAIAAGLDESPEAAVEMRAALELAPGEPGLALATAAAEFSAKELDSALAHAKQAGSRADALSLIADIQEQKGDYLEAVKALQAAVALAPHQEDLRIHLALELVQHQTFRPAIAVLEQSAPLFPKSARIHTLLGVSHYALGNNDAAASALTEAVRLDPHLEPAFSYLAKIVLESSAAAPGAAQTVLCQWNATVCAALRMRAARERNDSADLQEALYRLQQTPSDSVVGRCELARGCEWTGQWREARSPMEACVRLDPTPQNHYRLAIVYQRLGLLDLAQRELEERSTQLKRLSDEGARRLEATQGFQYTLK